MAGVGGGPNETQHSSVRLERDHHVLIITIDRPEARNAINIDMAWAISDALDRLEADRDLRLGIITGANQMFTAGADLKAAAGSSGRPLPDRGNFGICARPPKKPMIAAIEGFALGGGLEIALACDLVVASRTAQMGLPEVRRGVVAAGGGAFRLPRRIPYHLAMEIALTGTSRTAEFWHAHGLVNRLADPGEALQEALELARTIAANAPLAVAATTQIMRASLQWDDLDAWDGQNPILAPVRASADRTEGLAAFAEKRAPRWTGQ